MIAFSIDYTAFICLTVVTVVYIGYLIASSETLKSFAIDLKANLKSLNENFKTVKSSTEFTSGIGDFVEFHSSANQLSHINE